jgi:hypothetical protein
MNNLNLDELDQVSGGVFAYDVGRALRFLYLSGPQGHTMGLAVGDWIAVASQP